MSQPINVYTTRCPFAVGDRVQETDYAHRHHPAATVTAITASGFTYEFDTPVSFIPRWGMSFVGGECYPEGYQYWRKIST